ncbi:MAG: M1 family metallopeptidase [Anaerolineales bacterium]
MRSRTCAIALIAASFLAGCQLLNQTGPSGHVDRLPPGSEVSDPLDQSWSDYDLFLPGLMQDEPARSRPLTAASIYHLDVVVAQDLQSLNGREEIRFLNSGGAPLEKLYLRLFPNLAGGRLTVHDIRIDGQPVAASLQSGQSVLAIPLTDVLTPGRELVLQLSFALEIPQTMEGNYGLFGYHDGILLLQEFHPVIPAQTEAGWALEVPPPFGDLTSQPASYYLVRLQIPAGLTLISSGRMLQQGFKDADQVVLIADGPARDLYLAAGENLDQAATEEGGIYLIDYARPEFSSAMSRINEITASALGIFEELLSPYPYTELETFATPMQALGIEYPGAIGLTDRLYDHEATISGVSSQVYLESTVVHEVAHQWFYNLVGNDQVEDPWLDEAMAQYMTGLYFRERYGEQAYEQARASWVARWDRVDREPIPIGLPSSSYTSKEYGAIVYGRGPLFIEALADEMGEEDFLRFLRRYVDELRWKVSTPAQFERLAEETCSCELDALFDAWVFPQ